MKYAVIIIIALLLIIAVAVVFNVLAANAARKAEAEALRNRTYRPGDPFSSADDDAVFGDPRQLKPSDLVDIRGATFAVRGVIRFTQDGYNWIEAHLDTGTGRRAWISVEDDPDLEVVMWNELDGVTLTPGPATLELDGHRFSYDEDGSATFTSAGTTGVATSGSMRYHDYEAGSIRLSFEDFGSGWEASRGEVLARSEYRIYPSNPAPEGPQ
ncbi:DUF4178 domain-containing protein [Gordonia araii]|uniref:DUF4178 domain-containing protein n=1 Tax=Gordonia araii TaxID=263909 RepID=UPI00058DE8B1|nr:DUF4178 domain-containing protein [Gordonia araii]NNG97129.1 DUF4178 domain-containing protein [Gordonia araii NBRC 100433]